MGFFKKILKKLKPSPMNKVYGGPEYFRKKNRLQYLKSSGKNGRLILYCITGILFCIGLFFVFF